MSSSRQAPKDPPLPIGAVAERTGLSVSAIRFYESVGLVSSTRASSGHRRFRRSVIRRLSFIQICQRLGYSLDEIRSQLEQLPAGRTPTERDWNRLATGFASEIDERIAGLSQLRDKLDGCIGCGCLSLERCAIYNIDDRASALGDGPRYLLGDTPDTPSPTTPTPKAAVTGET
jgi:MerR family redox-sensitive transcriptional activator SoxR